MTSPNPTRIFLRTPPRQRARKPHSRPPFLVRWVRALFGPIPVTVFSLVVFVGLLTTLPLDESHDSAWLIAPLLIASSAILCGTLALWVHELGHLIGGQLAGYRFVMLAVGSMLIYSDGQKIRLRISNTWFWGGYTGSVPVGDHRVVWREILHLLGGPAASLMLGLSAFFIAALIETEPGVYDMTYVVNTLAWVTGFLSILVGTLSSGLSQYGIKSDRQRIFMLLRGGPVAERWIALRRVIGALQGGQRARDWNRAWIEQLIAVEDHSPEDALGNLYAYCWARDTNRIKLAGECIREAFESSHDRRGKRSPVICAEAAYYEARYNQDVANALELLDLARKNGGQDSMLAIGRAEAAIRLAEGNLDEARQWVDHVLALIEQRNLHQTGPGQAEMDWINDILRQIETKQAVQAPEESE